MKDNCNQAIGQVLGGMVVYVSGGQTIINPQINEVVSAPTSTASEIGPNSYEGLLAFPETDCDRFLGWNPKIKEILE